METLAVSLIVALVGAISSIAYKRPDHYPRIYLIVTIVLLAIAMFILGWDGGALKAQNEIREALSPHVSALPPEYFQLMPGALDRSMFGWAPYGLLVALGGWFWLLTMLPALGLTAKSKGDGE